MKILVLALLCMLIQCSPVHPAQDITGPWTMHYSFPDAPNVVWHMPAYFMQIGTEIKGWGELPKGMIDWSGEYSDSTVIESTFRSKYYFTTDAVFIFDSPDSFHGWDACDGVGFVASRGFNSDAPPVKPRKETRSSTDTSIYSDGTMPLQNQGYCQPNHH